MASNFVLLFRNTLQDMDPAELPRLLPVWRKNAMQSPRDVRLPIVAGVIRAAIRAAGYKMGRLRLARVRINRGGYSDNGTYFGIGQPVYQCHTEAGAFVMDFRASDRDAAKARVLSHFPAARFAR